MTWGSPTDEHRNNTTVPSILIRGASPNNPDETHPKPPSPLTSPRSPRTSRLQVPRTSRRKRTSTEAGFHSPEAHLTENMSPRSSRTDSEPSSKKHSSSSSSKSKSKSPKTDDWTEVSEPEERRRIQNRIAQRKFRTYPPFSFSLPTPIKEGQSDNGHPKQARRQGRIRKRPSARPATSSTRRAATRSPRPPTWRPRPRCRGSPGAPSRCGTSSRGATRQRAGGAAGAESTYARTRGTSPRSTAAAGAAVAGWRTRPSRHSSSTRGAWGGAAAGRRGSTTRTRGCCTGLQVMRPSGRDMTSTSTIILILITAGGDKVTYA